MKKWISIWLELGKVKITAAVSLTTLTGHLLFTDRLDISLLWTVTGIFLLASGASALNHIQELRYDSRMNRTRNRPLPSGRISEGHALLITVAYSAGGLILLYAGAGNAGMLMGCFTYFWYNVVYTYMKRMTPWAVIPGSLIGSIPPLIGWVGAGGSLLTSDTLTIAAFFFVWQVPHFWLLIIMYGEEYERAGFPSLTSIMSQTAICRLIFSWVVATSLITIVFTFTGPLESFLSKSGLWLLSGWLILVFVPVLKGYPDRLMKRKLFMRINLFVVMAVILMCTDKLLFVKFCSGY